MIRQIKYFHSVVRNNSFSEAPKNVIYHSLQFRSKYKRWKTNWALNCWKEKTESLN